MKIQTIVEGDGEVMAVPVLLRRLLAEAGCYTMEVGKPIRRTASEMRRQEGIDKAVRLARLDPACGAILVLFDEEDACPVEAAASVRDWAHRAAGTTPCEVVVAHREYETWFLAALDSLAGRWGLPPNAQVPERPESRRNAKGCLTDLMPRGRSYSETSDQASMSAALNFQTAHQNSRSFRKLVKAIGELLLRAGYPVANWPPPAWKPY